MRRYVFSLPASQSASRPGLLSSPCCSTSLPSTKSIFCPGAKFALLCHSNWRVYQVFHQLQPSLLLSHLTRKCRHLVQTARLYPVATSTYLVGGACTGSFPAVAISTSQTLPELLPAAVEAVLVSLKPGLHPLIVRHDIEASVPGEPKSALLDVRVTEAENKIQC